MIFNFRFGQWLWTSLLGMIFLIAFLSRLSVSIFAATHEENGDMIRYKQWAYVSYAYGLSDAYAGKHMSIDNKVINQPPGTVYILTFMYICYINTISFFFPILHHPQFLLHIFITIPSLLADIGIGILIYLLVEKKNKTYAFISSALFLLNPITIYNSAFWGQSDALISFFFVLSLFLLFKKNYFVSVFTLLISLYIKFSLVIFLPLYFLLFFTQEISKKKAMLYIIMSFSIFLLISLPVDRNPLYWLYRFFMTSIQGEDNHMTASAFNFWWVITKPHILFVSYIKTYGGTIGGILSDKKELGIPAAIWGYILFSTLGLILYIQFIGIKKARQVNNILLLFINTALIGFLFLPRMHERYLYPLFPLLAIYFGLTGKFLWAFIGFTILNFINIYLIWHPSVDLIGSNLQILTTSEFQWACSLCLTAIGVIFYTMSLSILIKERTVTK